MFDCICVIQQMLSITMLNVIVDLNNTISITANIGALEGQGLPRT